MRTTETSFTGISIYRNLERRDHRCSVYIGILCDGVIPEMEDMPKFILDVKFGGSAEQYCANLKDALIAAVHSKGVLVMVDDYGMGIVATAVTGEVREDADVKLEMYLMTRQ